VVARLNKFIADSTAGYESYELDNAVRPLGDFIDDLSTWYVRRSRDRFKDEGEDKQQALATLRHVLLTVAKVMAPVMPFFADDLYRRLRADNDSQSVHLCAWPEAGAVDEQLLAHMQAVRELASAGLKLREAAGLKVRQPLASFTATRELPAELAAILADELNVKEIKQGSEVALDTELTSELKEEGVVRDLVRKIQDERKTRNLHITDRPTIELALTDEEAKIAKKNMQKLLDATNTAKLDIANV
jgi:isoleucyl-tRNA synthetase